MSGYEKYFLSGQTEASLFSSGYDKPKEIYCGGRESLQPTDGVCLRDNESLKMGLETLFAGLTDVEDEDSEVAFFTNNEADTVRKDQFAKRLLRIVTPVKDHIERDQCKGCMKFMVKVLYSQRDLKQVNMHPPVRTLLDSLKNLSTELDQLALKPIEEDETL